MPRKEFIKKKSTLLFTGRASDFGAFSTVLLNHKELCNHQVTLTSSGTLAAGKYKVRFIPDEDGVAESSVDTGQLLDMTAKDSAIATFYGVIKGIHLEVDTAFSAGETISATISSYTKVPPEELTYISTTILDSQASNYGELSTETYNHTDLFYHQLSISSDTSLAAGVYNVRIMPDVDETLETSVDIGKTLEIGGGNSGLVQFTGVIKGVHLEVSTPLTAGAVITIVLSSSTERFDNLVLAAIGGTTDHTMLTNIGSNTHVQIDSHIADGTLHFTEASIDHLNIQNIGTNSHAAIDTHIADGTLHFTEASIDHTAIQNIGTNTHAQIDSHIADGTLHFTEASIDHTAIQNIGTNTHAQIDTHIADGTLHFTEASIDHAAIANIGTNSHAAIDSHIADGTLHFTEASIDHGSIAGLGDDDHTQYLRVDGTRDGTGTQTFDDTVGAFPAIFTSTGDTSIEVKTNNISGNNWLGIYCGNTKQGWVGFGDGTGGERMQLWATGNTFIDLHATASPTFGNIEFSSKNVLALQYDNAGTAWDFQANDIITSGSVGVGASVVPQSQLELYGTATQQITIHTADSLAGAEARLAFETRTGYSSVPKSAFVAEGTGGSWGKHNLHLLMSNDSDAGPLTIADDTFVSFLVSTLTVDFQANDIITTGEITANLATLYASNGSTDRLLKIRNDSSDNLGFGGVQATEGVGDVWGAAGNYGFQWGYSNLDNEWQLISGNQSTLTTRLTVGRDTGDFDFQANDIITTGIVSFGQTQQNGLYNYIPQFSVKDAMGLYRWENTGSPDLYFNYSRGAGVVGTHGALLNNDVIAWIAGVGSDGTDFNGESAAIAYKSDGAYSLGDRPGKIEFYTNSGGTDWSSLKMTLDKAGDLTVVGDVTCDLLTTAGIRDTSTGTMLAVSDSWVEIGSNTLSTPGILRNRSTDSYFEIQGGGLLTSQTGASLRLWSGSIFGVADDIEFTSDGGVTEMYFDQSAGTWDFQGSQIDAGTVVATQHYCDSTSTRNKYSVWNSTSYTIGMGSGYTYGGLNDFAMTFQMNTTATRGWWWGTTGHTNAQGAAALNIAGDITFAGAMRLNYGTSDTTAPGATHALDVNGTSYSDAWVAPFIDLQVSSATNHGGAATTAVAAIWDGTELHKDADYTHSTVTNPSRITVASAGRYHVKGVIACTNGGTNRITLSSRYRINGGAWVTRGAQRSYSRGTTYGTDLRVPFDFEVDLTASQYIEVGTYVEATDATYTANSTADSAFIMRRIG